MESVILTMGPSTPFLRSLESHNTRVLEIETKRFPDGEFFARVPVNIRNLSCYLAVQMTPENVFDVIVTIDTLKRAHAAKITLVTPYLPYSRQDRRVDTRTPISAKVLADCLEKAGCDHVVTMDVHALQIEGFYNIPFDNLQGATTLINAIDTANELRGDFILVAPDAGAAKRTRFLADLYRVKTVVLDKKRISDTEVESYLIGEITSPNCIIIDDMISTGGTILEATRLLRDRGAKNIYAACTHIISTKGIEFICETTDGLYHLDTTPVIQQPFNHKHNIIRCSDMFRHTIVSDAAGKSISSMFNQTSIRLI